MSIDSIVTVNLSLQTTAPTAAGFGVPLVIGNSQAIAPDLTREYDAATATDDMITDGYAATDLEYVAVSKLVGQSPHPTTVKVGRRVNPVTQAIVITVPDAIEGKVYSVTINGTTYSVTGDSTPTVAEIAGAIEDLITAAAITNLTATDNADGTFDLDAANGAMFRVAVSNVNMDDQTADANLATDMAAIVDVDNDWYALVNTCQSEAGIAATAAWIESRKKLYLASSGDADVIATGSLDVFSVVSGNNYNRTKLIWSHDPAQFVEGAWLGKMLPKDPGSATWNAKQLAGVSASTLTATQKSRIEDKGGNYIESINDIDFITEGKVAGGSNTFTDITRGSDWYVARLQERVFALFLNNDKVPGTDAGIQMIQAEIEDQNKEAIQKNVFAADPEPVVTMPKQADRSTADKAARALTGVTVEAVLAGAIHKTTFDITLTL